MAACTISTKYLQTMGDKLMAVAVCSAGTTIAAAAVGLKRIQYAWIQDTGDNAAVYITLSSNTVTLSAAPSGGTQTVFMVGF
jgi:hypothetical protein